MNPASRSVRASEGGCFSFPLPEIRKSTDVASLHTRRYILCHNPKKYRRVPNWKDLVKGGDVGTFQNNVVLLKKYQRIDRSDWVLDVGTFPVSTIYKSTDVKWCHATLHSKVQKFSAFALTSVLFQSSPRHVGTFCPNLGNSTDVSSAAKEMRTRRYLFPTF